MIARLVVIRMPVGVIPDDGDAYLGERTVVATAYRGIPWAIIRSEVQAVFLDIVLQPVAKHRVGLGVEINHVGRLRLVIITAYHVEVQVTFHVLDLRKRLHEGFRTEKTFLLPIPKGENDRALRLLAGSQECSRYLEDGRLERSNNRAERSIKPFVIDRKNFLFANTPGGAKGSVVIFTMIQTAIENHLDPYRYLTWLLKAANTADLPRPEVIEQLLPWNAPQECRMN